MNLVDRKSALWTYATDDVKGLLVDGELLVDKAKTNSQKISDYSFIVFPFAKAYEGFMKKMLLDLQIIKEDEYYGDEIRIGRILNPSYMEENENVFDRLCSAAKDDKDFTERMWNIWREGRNKVFHYFPHNFRKLSIDEAMDLIKEFLDVMQIAVESCYVEPAA